VPSSAIECARPNGRSCSSRGHIAGYTVRNDMTTRDIEGENPFYLPHAKNHDRSAISWRFDP
jgi:fumarylacetoacetate (FAA) hydrolase family protein